MIQYGKTKEHEAMKRLILVVAATVAVAVCAVSAAAGDSTNSPKKRPPSPSCRVSSLPFKLGVARYTLYKQPFERALEILQDIDCHYMGLVDSTIRRDASDAEIAAYKATCAKFGVEVVSLGPRYFSKEDELAAAFEAEHADDWASLVRNGGLLIVNKSGLPAGASLSGAFPASLSQEIDGICWQVADFDEDATALPQLMSLLEGGFNRPGAGAKWVIGGSFYYYSVMEAGYPQTPSWYPSNPDDDAFLADIYAQTNNLTDCIWMSQRGYNPSYTSGDRSWRADYVYASNQVWNAAVDVRLTDAPLSGVAHKAVRLTIKY